MYVEVVPVHGHRPLDEGRGPALGAVRDNRPEEEAIFNQTTCAHALLDPQIQDGKKIKMPRAPLIIYFLKCVIFWLSYEHLAILMLY